MRTQALWNLYLKTFVLDQFLNAIHDENISIVIYVSYVTGVKPTTSINSSCSFLLIFVVTCRVRLLSSKFNRMRRPFWNINKEKNRKELSRSFEEGFLVPCMTHWLRTHTSPGVFFGSDRPVSGSINLISRLGRMNPTEFFLATPWLLFRSPCVSVMQLCSVNPYACHESHKSRKEYVVSVYIANSIYMWILWF